MKNRISLIASLMFLVISFSAHSSANFEITPDIDTMVPENTLMYIQISNPDELMSNLDNFLSKTGINELMGNMMLKDMLAMLLESEDTGISLDYFNLSHPAGFAVLPPSGKFSNSDDIEFMVFIPINNTMNILKLISNRPESDNTWYTVFMNYLVYFSSKELKDDFPSNEIIDLSILDKYSNDSLSIYYDIQGLFKTFGDEIPAVMKELENNNSSDNDLAVRIIEGYFNIFYEIDSFFSNIKIDRKGISLQSDMFFSEDTERLLSSFDNTKDIQKWGSYLPEEGLFQSIYSLNSKDSKLIMDKIMEYLFPEIENDPMLIELKEYMEFTSQYTGNGGAFSIDISPSGNKSENEIFPFDISFSMVTELSDSDAFLKEFRDFYSSQSINNIMNSLYSDSGFKIQLTMEEIRLNEISPVFKLQYELKEKRTKSSNNYNEMDSATSFLNNVEFWYYIAEGKMYSYMGSGGVEGLKEIIIPNGHEKEWISTALDNSNLIWNFSLTNIFKLLEILPEIGNLMPKNNLAFDISGFSNIENGSIQSNAYISSKDIGNIFKLYKDMGF
ncbi:MAG: hypothetical protein KAQ93_06100 [Spirochaetales bacterium]|nr:hypothetical protein [Spirochaetales bacterium]